MEDGGDLGRIILGVVVITMGIFLLGVAFEISSQIDVVSRVVIALSILTLCLSGLVHLKD